MTLGNDPQPLTRRQLRELARAQAPESGVDEGNDEDFQPDKPATAVTSAFAPRKAANQVGDDDLADDDKVAEAFSGDPLSALTTERATVPERTLTRRELRDLMAARQAETGVAPDADVMPSGFVIDREVIDDDIPENAFDDEVLDENALDGESPDEVALDDVPPAPALSLPPQAFNTSLNPPVGHWSIDRDVDEHPQLTDQNQPFDQLLSRGVAAGGIPTTTNALILPSIPQQGNPSGSLTSTGEILITGSIDLPRSLGATGQHPNHFDSSEMDHLMDPLDDAGPTAGVAPVSASRAVSTHTSTRGVMTPPTKRVASLPIILAITAGVLLVGVLALFAAGYLFQIF